jgi:heat shock protein HslJ
MDLTGTSWIVISIDDGSGRLAPIIEGTTPTFAYDGERVNGSAGCNSYFGTASLGGDVTVGPLASTLMFCSEPVGIMSRSGASWICSKASTRSTPMTGGWS